MKLSLFFVCLYISVNAQNEPLLPGDFNMDGIVSIHDALYWGLAHGETGPPRTAATINWTPQPTDDWDESIRQVNNKFQDGDGNGLIDTFDLEALHQNFDSTHMYVIKDGTDRQSALWIVHFASENSVERMHRYEVRMKDDSLHGIAFTFDFSNFDNAVLDIGVSLDGLPLENDALIVEVLEEAESKLHLAITRTDKTNYILVGEPIVNIVVCEDVASLTAPPKVYVKDAEILQADEGRVAIYDHEFQTPPPPMPECKVLWNGEQCLYQNGTINSQVVDYNFAFEGWLDDKRAGIQMGCHRWQGENISQYDSLSFLIRTNEEGIGKSIGFFIADIHGNLSNPFIVNELDTAFQQFQLPLQALENDEPILEAIDWIYFEALKSEDEFTIYVDQIVMDGNTPLWNGEKCYYRDGTINEENAHTGQYSFERIVEPYEWNHSVIDLNCQQDMTVNLSLSDEIRFYAKADQLGKTFDFYVSEAFKEWGNCNALDISHYIEGGELTADYRLVTIPLEDLKNENCLLEKVQNLHFFNPDDIEFKFYIDDIEVYSETGCFTPAEVPEQTEYQQLIIYPNPASEILSIQLHARQSTQGEVRIFDMQGRILDHLSIQLTAGPNTFTYAPTILNVGLYVIHIQSENNIYNGKFVVSN